MFGNNAIYQGRSLAFFYLFLVLFGVCLLPGAFPEVLDLLSHFSVLWGVHAGQVFQVLLLVVLVEGRGGLEFLISPLVELLLEEEHDQQSF